MCPVAQLLHREASILHGADAPRYDNVFDLGQGVDFIAKAAKQIVRIVGEAFGQAEKLVGFKTTANAPICDTTCTQIGNFAQEILAREGPIDSAYAVEIHDVAGQDVIVFIGILAQDFPCMQIKGLSVVKPGQTIILQFVDKGRLFPQVDDVFNSLQDDLGLIGFCHKIGRTL